MDLFTLPTAASTTAGVGAYSIPWTLEFIPFAFLIIGVLIAAMAGRKVISTVLAAVRSFFTGGRKGGGRRGRR